MTSTISYFTSKAEEKQEFDTHVYRQAQASWNHFSIFIKSLLIKMCLHDEFGSRNNHPLSNVCFSQEVYTYLIKLKCSFRTVTPVKCFVMNGHIRICDICYNKVNFNNVMNFVMEHFCKYLPSTKSVLDEERYFNLAYFRLQSGRIWHNHFSHH